MTCCVCRGHHFRSRVAALKLSGCHCRRFCPVAHFTAEINKSLDFYPSLGGKGATGTQVAKAARMTNSQAESRNQWRGTRFFTHTRDRFLTSSTALDITKDAEFVFLPSNAHLE